MTPAPRETLAEFVAKAEVLGYGFRRCPARDPKLVVESIGEVTLLILFYLDSTSSYIHILRGMRTAR